MSGNDQIVYKVLTRDDRGWRTHGGIGDMSKAMKAADQLFQSGKYREAKVDKQYYDPRNDRTVNTTILHRKAEEQTAPPWKLITLVLAVVILAVSFAVAYTFGLQFP